MTYLTFGGISDKSLGVGEGDITGCSAVALVVGDYLHFAVLPDANAGIRCSQINSNSGCFHSHFVLSLTLDAQKN